MPASCVYFLSAARHGQYMPNIVKAEPHLPLMLPLPHPWHQIDLQMHGSCMYLLLKQCRFQFICVAMHKKEDRWILKDSYPLWWGGFWKDVDCPQLHFKDVCKHDMKALKISTDMITEGHGSCLHHTVQYAQETRCRRGEDSDPGQKSRESDRKWALWY